MAGTRAYSDGSSRWRGRRLTRRRAALRHSERSECLREESPRSDAPLVTRAYSVRENLLTSCVRNSPSCMEAAKQSQNRRFFADPDAALVILSGRNASAKNLREAMRRFYDQIDPLPTHHHKRPGDRCSGII